MILEIMSIDFPSSSDFSVLCFPPYKKYENAVCVCWEYLWTFCENLSELEPVWIVEDYQLVLFSLRLSTAYMHVL